MDHMISQLLTKPRCPVLSLLSLFFRWRRMAADTFWSSARLSCRTCSAWVVQQAALPLRERYCATVQTRRSCTSSKCSHTSFISIPCWISWPLPVRPFGLTCADIFALYLVAVLNAVSYTVGPEEAKA